MKATVVLDAEQEEIRAVARGFLRSRLPAARRRELLATEEGFDRATWEEIAELGWNGIALPEARGGAGYTVVERCLLLEEMGRVLYSGPYLASAVLAADALELAGERETVSGLLAELAAGTARATLIAGGDLLGGPNPAGEVEATATGAGFRLDGQGGLALNAIDADHLIVVAAVDGLPGLFAVAGAEAGVRRRPAPTIDETRATALVGFEGAAADRLDDGRPLADALARVLERGAVGLAAEAVGAAQEALEMTVAYMGEREQFGGPIGRFQALKHRLADLYVAIDAARESVYAGAEASLAEDRDQAALAAAAAQAAATEAFVQMGAEAVQLHGGVGFTEEHDIGLYYKRALVSAATLGRPVAQLERIAGGLGV